MGVVSLNFIQKIWPTILMEHHCIFIIAIVLGRVVLDHFDGQIVMESAIHEKFEDAIALQTLDSSCTFRIIYNDCELGNRKMSIDNSV